MAHGRTGRLVNIIVKRVGCTSQRSARWNHTSGRYPGHSSGGLVAVCEELRWDVGFRVSELYVKRTVVRYALSGKSVFNM